MRNPVDPSIRPTSTDRPPFSPNAPTQRARPRRRRFPNERRNDPGQGNQRQKNPRQGQNNPGQGNQGQEQTCTRFPRRDNDLIHC